MTVNDGDGDDDDDDDDDDISVNQLTSTLVFFCDFEADLSLQVLIVLLESSEAFYKVFCNSLFYKHKSSKINGYCLCLRMHYT